MSETIPTMEGRQPGAPTPKSPEKDGSPTALRRAFEKLGQELGVSGGEKELPTALVEKLTEGAEEKPTATVTQFPFEKTSVAQERLGSEIGWEAGQLIGKHVQGNIKSVSSDTIPHMEGEKHPSTTERMRDLGAPPEETPSPQPLETQQRIGEIVTAIDELEKKGGNKEEIDALEAELQGIYSGRGPEKQKELVVEVGSAPAPINEPAALEHAELDPTAELTLSQIEEEVAALRQKKEEARAQIRDHSQRSIDEPLKAIHEINARIKHLEGKSIRAAIQKMPLEELVERRAWALEQLKDHNVNYKTEATAILVYTSERLNEGKNEKKSKLTIDEQQQRKINKRVPKATTPDVVTHIKAVGLGETEEVVPKSETTAPVVKVTQKESAEELKQFATAEEAPPQQKQENPYDLAMKKIAAEDPARAERLMNAVGATPEQRERIEKLFTGLENFEKGTIEKETAVGVLDWARKWGEKYQQIPISVRVGVGIALISGSILTGGAGFWGSTFALGIVLRRGMTGLGTFAIVEGLGRKWVDNSKIWENDRDMGRKFAAAGGIIAGVLAGGGAKILLDYYEGLHTETTPVLKVPESVPVEPLKESVEASTDTHYAEKIEGVREVLKSEALVQQPYAVQEGDKLWNILKEKLPEVQSLAGEEAKQSNAIANIIEQIKKDPASFGITSGNVDNLTSGDVLNMEKVHSVLENAKISVGGVETTILERAEGLSDTEVSHIEANNEKLAEWQVEHPGEQLTTETTDKILNESSVGEAPSENFDNVRKDMETAEAISMKTDQIFRADIQTMFGSQGLFGYGFLGTNGERSVDWLDLKDRPVQEVLSKTFDQTPSGEESIGGQVGIDSFNAVDKIKGYMNMLIERTGLTPEKTESVDHFVHRAIHSIASK